VIGVFIIENLIPNYEPPLIVLSLDLVVTAGPIEDTLFFGIPFYASFGNHLVILASGIIWIMTHILNINTFDIMHLPYANIIGIVGFLFFFLRTWISEKGWFSIVIHSAYDSILFIVFCNFGGFSCRVSWYEGDLIYYTISLIIISAALPLLVYFLYRREHNREYKYHIYSNNKQFQFRQLKWLAILILVIIAAGLLFDYLSAVLVITLGTIFVLSFERYDHNRTNNTNKQFQFQQLKWLAIFIASNFTISLIIPFPFVLFFIAAIFILLRFERKRRLRRLELGDFLMISSKSEQLIWIGIFFTITFAFTFRIVFPFSYITLYGALLLLIHYMKTTQLLKKPQ